MSNFQIITGDALEVTRGLEAESVQTVVTSPPYWKQRDYGHAGQVGQEVTPELYVERLAEVFAEVRRVLKPDGTMFLNLDDKYRDKQLLGLPWRVAFALQSGGWLIRCDNIWNKAAGRTEAVTDRCTRVHEYVFHLSKGPRYLYDAEAVREESAPSSVARARYNNGKPSPKNLKGVAEGVFRGPRSMRKAYGQGRNKRSVWDVAAQGTSGSHFAVFPETLVEPCVLAGSREGDTVLDPFCGTGTVGAVALRHGRNFVGVELNPFTANMARTRIRADAPMFNVERTA